MVGDKKATEKLQNTLKNHDFNAKNSSANPAQSGTVADPTPVVKDKEAGAGSKSNTHTSFTK
jgi:hypothetical protein